MTTFQFDISVYSLYILTSYRWVYWSNQLSSEPTCLSLRFIIIILNNYEVEKNEKSFIKICVSSRIFVRKSIW